MSDYLNLTQDLFAEILVRLPIQDLVKSTAVCKSWNSLIKNPTFISTHLQKTISFNNAANRHLLLFRLCTDTDPDCPYSVSFAENYSLRFHLPSNNFGRVTRVPGSSGESFGVAGSINGLVCLVDDTGSYIRNIFLWNPIIKKALSVPTPGVTFSSPGSLDAFIGFGFDSKTDDYKLLRFVEFIAYDDDPYSSKEPKIFDDDTYLSNEHTVEVEIYSLNSNCWRTITHIAPKYGLGFDFPRTYGNSFVNGAIHMLAGKDRNLILAFDVSKEVFREIPLPECLSKGYTKLRGTKLLTYGQSIAAMTWAWDGWDGNKEVEQTHLWVMKEYGVALSWSKVFTEVAESVPRVLFFRQDEEQVFVFRKDEEEVSMTMKGGSIASVDI